MGDGQENSTLLSIELPVTSRAALSVKRTDTVGEFGVAHPLSAPAVLCGTFMPRAEEGRRGSRSDVVAGGRTSPTVSDQLTGGYSGQQVSADIRSAVCQGLFEGHHKP